LRPTSRGVDMEVRRPRRCFAGCGSASGRMFRRSTHATTPPAARSSRSDRMYILFRIGPHSRSNRVRRACSASRAHACLQHVRQAREPVVERRNTRASQPKRRVGAVRLRTGDPLAVNFRAARSPVPAPAPGTTVLIQVSMDEGIDRPGVGDDARCTRCAAMPSSIGGPRVCRRNTSVHPENMPVAGIVEAATQTVGRSESRRRLNGPARWEARRGQ
jgi:hypothetical protein